MSNNIYVGNLPWSFKDDTLRELFEEHFEIIMKAWTNDVFEHKGKHWQIPTENINWPAKDVAHEFGKGCDEDGIIKQIGIAPGLYNDQGNCRILKVGKA